MGLLLDAARAWEKMCLISYQFTYGMNKKLHHIVLSFQEEQFAHLSGIHYISDIDLSLPYKKSNFLTMVLHGNIPEESITRTYHDVPFVVVNDNYFNHMKFLPEMMRYDHSLILNTTRGELDVLADDPMLEREGRLVVSLPAYLDNSALLEQISQSTGFHQVTTLCTSPDGPRDREVKANLYLVSR